MFRLLVLLVLCTTLYVEGGAREDTFQKLRAQREDTLQTLRAQRDETLRGLRTQREETLRGWGPQREDTLQKLRAQREDTLLGLRTQREETLRGLGPQREDTLQKLISSPDFRSSFRQLLNPDSGRRQDTFQKMISSTDLRSGLRRVLNPESCPTIISRQEWGSKYRCSKKLSTPVSLVIIHHTVGASCYYKDKCKAVVRNTQEYHTKKRDWCDIGYNFLIGEDGNVYEGRGWTTLGTHASEYNGKSIGISFMGNFMNRAPNLKAQEAAKELIACGVRQNYIKSNYVLKGHRDVESTSCPGDEFYKFIQKWHNFNAKG